MIFQIFENIQRKQQRVMLCFRMWEDNSIYPTDVLINMQNSFLGLSKKKEADEQQRLQEALVEFQESFDDEPLGHVVPKTFIRGDIVNAPNKISIKPSLYKPQPIMSTKITLKPPSVTNVEQARKIAEEAAKKIMLQASSRPKNIPINRPPKPDTKKLNQSAKMSNLEIFKEELKQVQAMREERKGVRLPQGVGTNDLFSIPKGGGEFDDDPTTTNLYVSNLPLDIQMEDIYDTFGSFGPLASAKILYPRPDDERKRDSLCGFIAFINRIDATRAFYIMSGEKIKDSELRVSWARPVTIPPVPFYIPIVLRELAMPDPPSGLPFNAKPLSSDLRNFLQKYHNLPRLNSPLPDDSELLKDYKKIISNSIVRVVIPTDRPLLAIIHRVIEFIVREGPIFEAIIMSKERANPMYRFLFENFHPTHIYYRWKLFSVLQGDDRIKWRLERFKIFQDGSWWEPPPHSLFDNGMPPQLYNTAYVAKKRPKIEDKSRKRLHRACSNSSNEDESRKRSPPANEEERTKKWRGLLHDSDRMELDEILNNILPEKTSIGDAMVWCLEHADSAKEIVQCIYESLSISSTPLHKKIALIYLCSDILANCSVRLRDVFYYRQYFNDNLLKIFISLNQTLENIQSRIKGEQFRQRVMLCFRMWEDNSIYPTDVLINMQNIFLGLSKVESNNNYDAVDHLDGEPIDDLDGEPIYDDIDGVPLDNIDGVPLDNIDGVPLDYIDGVPFDDEVGTSLYLNEGEYNNSKIKNKFDQHDNDFLFKTSSWSRVNTAENSGISSKWEDGSNCGESENENSRDSNSHDVNESLVNDNEKSGINMSYSKEYDEERRKMLRDIEVKIVKLQDKLECEQCKDVEAELDKYRRKLTNKMEEKLLQILKKLEKSSKHRQKSPKNSKHRNSSVEPENREKERSRKKDYSKEKDRHRNGEDRDKERRDRSDRDNRERRRDRSSERKRR